MTETKDTSTEVGKHTPGPWRIERFKRSANVRIQPASGIAPGGSLADVYGSEANGLLIAAAPELLDAARLVLDWCDRGGPIDWALIKPFQEATRAAISRAEGGA